MSARDFFPRAANVPGAIGGELQRFGGLLRCTVCGGECPLGDVVHRLTHGWPRCCGYTMRWITQRELDAARRAGEGG